MAKVKVYELAKELDKQSKEIIAMLQDKGIEVKAAQSSVEEDVAEMVRSAFGAKKAPAQAEEKPASKEAPKAPAAKEAPVEKEAPAAKEAPAEKEVPAAKEAPAAKAAPAGQAFPGRRLRQPVRGAVCHAAGDAGGSVAGGSAHPEAVQGPGAERQDPGHCLLDRPGAEHCQLHHGLPSGSGAD